MPAFAIYAWIIVAPLLARALTPVQMVIWLTLVPYLFLPEAFSINLPGMPDIDKTAAVAIGLLLSFLTNRSKFAEVPQPPARIAAVTVVILTCLVMIVVGTLLTVVTNPEPIIYDTT